MNFIDPQDVRQIVLGPNGILSVILNHAEVLSLLKDEGTGRVIGAKIRDRLSDEVEDEEKEKEHSSLQERLDMEIKELDKKLKQKEAEMKRFSSVDPSVLTLRYEKKVQELEHEKKALQREIEELRCNLDNMASTSDDGTQKLKGEYLQKLNLLESQDIDNIFYETEYRREWCTSKWKPSGCFLFARKFTRPAALRLLNMSVLGASKRATTNLD